MTFVDITVVPVRRDRKQAYVEFARRMAAVYLDHGATRIVDYWQTESAIDPAAFHADGVAYGTGELLSLGDVSGATGEESVVVTITEWPSRAARDRGTAAATSDSRVTATLDEEPVFDGSRVVADCFEVTMDLAPGRQSAETDA